jgi:von Willebrand factor
VWVIRNPSLLKQGSGHQSPAQADVSDSGSAPESQVMPAPGPPSSVPAPMVPKADPPAPSSLPTLLPRGYQIAADQPSLELPVETGKSSLDWIRAAIREKREMPERNAVRLEEILNSFTFRLNGLTGIARLPASSWHPDTRSIGATSHAATVSTETMPCPWRPSATLVLITLRGNANSDCEIKAVFHAKTEHVRRFKLLGFSPVEGRKLGPLPSILPAMASTTLAVEVEPSTSSNNLGAIEWSVNQQKAPSIQINRHSDVEPSDDARFAALVCTYAQWLSGEAIGLVDAELVAALARENAAETLTPDRMDLLNLIDQSLDL